MIAVSFFLFFFVFFNDTGTTELYTLSLHDALPISGTADAGIDDGQMYGVEGKLEGGMVQQIGAGEDVPGRDVVTQVDELQWRRRHQQDAFESAHIRITGAEVGGQCDGAAHL